MNDRFYVKKTHMTAVATAILIVLLGALAFAGVQVVRARAQVASLNRQSERQSTVLRDINAKTNALRAQLQRVQKQNQEIQSLIGAPSPHPLKTSWVRRGLGLAAIAANVRSLSAASSATQRQSDGIKTLALRVLNVRHLQDVARAREIAAIPSIDPVAGAQVVGCFCYRTAPDVEFHEGVDLGADYGQPVRAAAAGTVVSSGYDGAYGIKIDIDHGNGYHTWYAHLSRTDVAVGERVYKGQPIALVGATGFATGPHLHYQVMYDGTPVDPAPFLNGVPPNVLAALP